MATMGMLSGFLHDQREVGVEHGDARGRGRPATPSDQRHPRPSRSPCTCSDRKKSTLASVMKIGGSVRKLTTLLERFDEAHGYAPSHSGPEMPPSLRTRQKWTAIRIPATSGMPTQCRT